LRETGIDAQSSAIYARLRAILLAIKTGRFFAKLWISYHGAKDGKKQNKHKNIRKLPFESPGHM